ncbi:MAG: PhzF family phenazine biosynthesis protein [Pseudomonadales bacterium]|nr:PhzF family phenazine biosynthesis protein [Pseudomonadales bacterium]
MTKKLFHIDAFTEEPFKGNPAAICFMQQDESDSWLAAFAAEMNLPITAYIIPHPNTIQDNATPSPDAHFSLRSFTPNTEMTLCGHATLASAHALWESKVVSKKQNIVFHTKDELLTAKLSQLGIEIDLPLINTTPLDQQNLKKEIEALLNCDVIEIHQCGNRRLALLPDAEQLTQLNPDLGKLKSMDIEGLIITAASTQTLYDFVSRFFAPKVGVDEDHVTGSAHCALASFWSQKTMKTQFNAYQASPRSGSLKLTLKNNRVLIRGQAKTILTGEIYE